MKIKNRILLSVTGMSPAVVTETLYALVVEKQFIPTEIRVITTEQGKNKLLDALLGIEGGRQKAKGALQEFIEDYGQQYGFNNIHFDESCIHVIRDSDGNILSDIRSPEENQNAADQIVQLVGDLCKDPQNEIHVSIAGGRKTMGFFLGYALSLYGRKQDSLSHVLVAEEFENLPSFFYPKPYDYFINDRQGRQINAKNSQVMLAEIPWVRLGLGVPDELLGNRISYSDSVYSAQQILDEPQIRFLEDADGRFVQFGSQMIKLSPRAYSLLLSVCIAKKEGWNFDPMQENRVKTLYAAIYEWSKSTDRLLQSMNNYVGVKQVLSDSQTDIRKKVQKAFLLSNHTKTPYVPTMADGYYHLPIANENIDLSEIDDYIQRIKRKNDWEKIND